jgi:hypothetical protein
MEVSVETIHLLIRRRASEDLQGIPVPRQADPRTSVDVANDPALMAIHCVGAGHCGAISSRHQRVSVPLCRHRQVHQMAGSNLSDQNQ